MWSLKPTTPGPAVFAVVNSTLHHDTDIHGAPVRFRRPWEIRELLEI